jgi:hypothetical protein
VIARVTDNKVDTTARLVFEAGEEGVLERAAKQDTEGSVFKDVGMHFEGNVSNLHGEILRTSNGPAHGATGTFHL